MRHIKHSSLRPLEDKAVRTQGLTAPFVSNKALAVLPTTSRALQPPQLKVASYSD